MKTLTRIVYPLSSHDRLDIRSGDPERLLQYMQRLVVSLKRTLANLEREVRNIDGSATWDPGAIADGDEEAKEVTVYGALVGDFALASFSLDVSDLVLNAQVTAADTVTCVLANNTGGAVDLASGTGYVRVFKR